MTQRLNSLLDTAPELTPLLDKARSLSALQAHVIEITPLNLVQSAKIQVLGLKLGTLSIAVANAAIAAKMRQLAPELVVKLQNKGCEVSGIRVKVQVSYDQRQIKPIPRKICKIAQNALKDLSFNLESSPLKSALDRLSKSEC
ncbi:MAG: DciA family protein [Gallionella sp.]